jgi:hypothetical protein
VFAGLAAACPGAEISVLWRKCHKRHCGALSPNLTSITHSGKEYLSQPRAINVSHWTFWEWVAYGSLFVAALIIAADTSFKLAPDVMARLPEFFHSEWWGFAPVVLVVAATIILLLREFVFKPRQHTSEGSETSETANVTAIQPTIKHGLYVGEILAGFDKLREDYVIEISIRAYNGTGGPISLSAITGAILYTTEALPPAVVLDRGQKTKGIQSFTEMLFVLEQRMPSQLAMKLLAALDEGKQDGLDLRQFNILISLDSSPNEIERLPVFSITFKKHETIAQGRIAYAEMRAIG